MIVKEEFLSRLRKIFDLNLYEVRVWTALLSRGVSTAGELSAISDVPRSRTYDILESLEKKNFIMMKLGKPIKFVAIKPEEVVERAKKNLLVDAHEKTRRLEQLKGDEVLKELSDLFTNGVKYVEPSDLSGSLKGRSNMYNHLDMMLRGAEKTITIITTSDGLNRKVDALLPTFEQVKKKGVKIRLASPITEKNLKYAKDLAKVAEIRDCGNVKARLIIIDSEEIMFMIMDDESVHPNYDTGIWINAPFFASALEQLFEVAWKEFKPFNGSATKKKK